MQLRETARISRRSPAITAPLSKISRPRATARTKPPASRTSKIPAAMSQALMLALPVAVVAPRRDIGEVERRRAPAPHPGADRHQPRQVLQRRGQGRSRRRTARRWQRSPRSSRGARRPACGVVVHPGARALFGHRTSRPWPHRRPPPTTISPLCSSAIDTAQCGSPCRKFVVPSSGSTIQRRVGSAPVGRAGLLAQPAIGRPRRPSALP